MRLLDDVDTEISDRDSGSSILLNSLMNRIETLSSEERIILNYLIEKKISKSLEKKEHKRFVSSSEYAGLSTNFFKSSSYNELDPDSNICFICRELVENPVECVHCKYVNYFF